jgi:proteasome lid subunit RPN8/RPN11
MLKIGIAECAQIRRYVEETYPDEACGILLGTFSGDVRIVRVVVDCVNATQDSTHTHYSIEPGDLVRAQRDARDRGLEIVGFYHSHPDHPARWSPTDLAEAHWIGCSYLIVAIENAKAGETGSFVLLGRVEEDKQFVDEELLVIEPDG